MNPHALLLLFLFLVFLVVFIWSKACSICPRISHASPNMVHLVLFSPSFPYTDMMNITRPLYQASGIPTLYYCYDPHLTTAIDWNPTKCILRIRGNESYVPGILLKTLDAFSYALQAYPDAAYFVRSNASSVIDIPTMTQEIMRSPEPVQYGGYMLNNLTWLDPAGGVVDQTWWGTRYASGTCIVMSRDCVQHLVTHRERCRPDLVDDLSIGVFMREYLPHIRLWQSARLSPWLYRNRQSNNRNEDLHMMRAQVAQLIQSFQK